MSVSSSRRSGDHYQDLYAWLEVLELLGPRPPAKVGIEWTEAKHVDDVVVFPASEHEPIRAIQIKFHVDMRSAYSVDALTSSDTGGATLLQKFWRAWQQLGAGRRAATLTLVSNWPWEPNDALAGFIGGKDGAFKESLFTSLATKEAKELLEQLRSHLGVGKDELFGFLQSLRWRLGFDPALEVEDRVRERMENRGLSSDEQARLVGVGIVGQWIRDGVEDVTREALEDAIQRTGLRTAEAEPVIKVVVHTIERQNYSEPADFQLDWCDCFGGNGRPDREICDPQLWNGRFLAELRALKSELNAQPIRLLRVRGQARLSVWLALGFILDCRAGYLLEVEQGGQRWRSSTAPATGYGIVSEDSNGSESGREVAISLSVTQDISEDVRRAIHDHNLPVIATLSIMPETGPGRGAFKGAAHVVAFAEQARAAIAAFMKRYDATRAHLFYCGPLSGAAFLGNVLGAAAPEIQLYEDLRPGYAKSFLLRA